MKIYSLFLIKNEVDIIVPVLKSAVQWSDKVIVYDNGSTDGSWEKVKELAEVYPSIIPFIQDARPFRIGLRAIMFDAFKHEMTKNDWWCIRADADEFYIDNPREFLAKIPIKYKQVWKDSIDFQLTTEDIEEYEFLEKFEKDEPHINYYNKKTWTEIRFLRHSNRLHWNVEKKLPSPKGLTFPTKIRVKHYQFRSPAQLQKRFETRQKAIAENCSSFKHEKGKDWKYYLTSRVDLIKDSRNGQFHTEGCRNTHIKKRELFIKTLLNLLHYY